MKKSKIVKLRDVCKTLGEIAPLDLAAEWDNVGLLIGSEDSNSKISRMLLCIDLTEEVDQRLLATAGGQGDDEAIG